MRAVVAGLGLLTVAGCASHAVRFDGHARDAIVTPEAVVEATEVPRDAERLGRLLVRCTPVDDWEPFDDVSLVDLDCTEERARRMLREAAADNGGDVLVGTSCEAGGAVVCRAVLARHVGLVARTAARRPPDVRGAPGQGVLVEFSPELARAPGPPRGEAAVRDVPALPPSHRVVGSVATRCEDCAELAARDALRIAVGRLGGTDAVAVRCQAWGGGHRCAGAAAIAEREPDPAAN